jgi:uncharacterized protein YjiS (DUF1127 family)
MHNLHCCYAPKAISKPADAAYLSIVPKKQTDSNQRRTTMNLIRNYRNWRRYRDTVSELNRLSTRELTDLGIARGDIPFVARKSI